MRLYLSSYKFGNHPEELSELVGVKEKAAVILNALDFGDKTRIQRFAAEQVEQLNNLGLDAKILDLRDYFGEQNKLRDHLSDIGLVWITGGNVFILQRAFEQSGFGEIIKKSVVDNEIVYSGFSAATCLATPTLRGSEFVDDPSIVPEGYKEDFSWEGLGFLYHNIAVHYKSGHEESDDIEKEIQYYKENNIQYSTLKDGEVLIIDGDEKRIAK